MLRMLVPTGQPFAGMAFHRVHGTEWSPLPGLPHEDPTTRVLHRPSTAATLHVAAVAAAAARTFAGTPYAARLLAAARRAHAAAHRHPRLVAPDDEGRFGGGPYGDDRLDDDFYWAAAELWLATGERPFLAELMACADHTGDVFDLAGFDFDRVAAAARIDLALVESALPDRDRVRASVVAAGERLLALQADQPGGSRTRRGAGWDWGSNGRILNNLVVLVAARAISGERRFRDGVAVGVDYLLGRNALGQSYVTGYGPDATRHLRTPSSATTRRPARWREGRTPATTPGWPTDPRLGRAAAAVLLPRRKAHLGDHQRRGASGGTPRSPPSPHYLGSP
jgi:endoglucanase